MRRYVGLLVVMAAALVSCGAPAAAPPTPTIPTPATIPTSTTAPAPTSCHVSGSGELVLPDPRCTPGAAVPSYTQAQLCAGKHPPRPPVSVTEPEKVRSIAQYGDYAGASPSQYEFDHLVPLELGGASTQANLWPEYDMGVIPNRKDRVENAAKAAVCSGHTLTLAQAQAKIASDWIALAHELGVTV